MYEYKVYLRNGAIVTVKAERMAIDGVYFFNVLKDHDGSYNEYVAIFPPDAIYGVVRTDFLVG